MLDQVVFPLSAEKNPLATAGDLGLIPWEDPLEKEMASCSVFLPGEFHGQRSLVGSSPLSHKDSDTTWQLNKNNKILFLEC